MGSPTLPALPAGPSPSSCRAAVVSITSHPSRLSWKVDCVILMPDGASSVSATTPLRLACRESLDPQAGATAGRWAVALASAGDQQCHNVTLLNPLAHFLHRTNKQFACR